MGSYDIIAHGPDVTMMVADCALNGPIDMRVAYSLLPVFRPGKVEILKGDKIPHYKIPGSIVTLDFVGDSRGLIRKKKSYFKNSVSMDISCVEKNANVKLSPQNIHLCGVTSLSIIHEVVDYLISYIKEIQELLTFAAENPDLRDKTIEWLKDVSMGITIKRHNTMYKGKLKVVSATNHTLIRAISAKDISDSPDEKLAKLYLRMIPEIVYHDDFCRLLDWCKNISWVCDSNLAKLEPVIHMRNTNSKLNFNVGICFIFAIIFQEKFPDYNISYDNTMKPSTITITIPYIPTSERLAISKKSADEFAHTFMLQGSGSFTHSGPWGPESEIGYNKFISAMKIMEKLIPRDNDKIMKIAKCYL